MTKRTASFYWLTLLFIAYVIFLYGPTIIIFILSFQGPDGGLTFPLNGMSFHWFYKLFFINGTVDIGSAFRRSLLLGLVVMILTVVLSTMAGLAFRKKFFGQGFLFYVTVASLIMPSIVVSLGIALEFHVIDDVVKILLPTAWLEDFNTTQGLLSSGLGAHLTWTLPFGLLIMFAVFNRFDSRLEEAARDMGATPWQTFVHVVLPLILPSLIGIGLFGFTLSFDEIARSSQAIGAYNTLPMELKALTTTVTTPEIYALGTVTTSISLLVIFTALAMIKLVQSRQARHGSDAGKGLV